METLQDLVNSLIDNETKNNIAKSARNSKGQKFHMNFDDIYNQIMNYAKGFYSMGLKQDDHVVFLADNTYDWINISLGLNYTGIIDVPRGTDSTSDEIEFILKHSDSKAVVVQNQTALNKVLERKPDNIKKIITMFDHDDFISTNKILENSKNVSINFPTIKPEDLSGIIYTSGTTSNPKGVMLTHENFLTNVKDVVKLENISSEYKWLTFLPPWHVFQRVAEYIALYVKAEMFHTTPIPSNIAKELRNEKPHIITSVPRIWEGIYDKTIKTLEKTIEEMNVIPKTIFNLAYPKIIPKKFIPTTIKKKINESLGGNLVFAVSGGAKFPEHVGNFFRKAGVDIIDGYGMTETSPVISAQMRGKKSKNTIGFPISSMDVRIANYDTNEINSNYSIPGEIQVQGPCVMAGYYKNKQATEESFTLDGWFKTGDKGHFNNSGELIYDGRYKNTIVLANGENLDPESLENTLLESQYVSSSIVFGENRNIYAIIVPDFSKIQEYCDKQGIKYDSENLAQITSREDVKEILHQEISKYVNSNKNLGQRISNFAILPRDLKDGIEITQTKKPKRNVIMDTFKDYINEIIHP